MSNVLIFNQKLFWSLTLFSIVSLLVVYVFQVNSFTQSQYLLQNYQKKSVQISNENKILEINFSDVNSLHNLEKYLSNQNFIKTKQIKYLQIMENQVARK